MTISLSELIRLLPSLMMYIIPGIAFMFVFQLGSTAHDAFKINISLSIIIGSYILNVLIQQIGDWIKHPPNDVMVIFCSALFGLIFALLRNCQWFDVNIIGKFFHRTIDDNVWFGISDREFGCYVEAFLKDANISYSGKFHNHYTNKDGTWITISNFVLKNNGIVNIEHNKEMDDDFEVAINANNIERMEIQYHPDSLKKK